MQIIIVGCGNVGAALTEQLSGEGHDVTVIEEKKDVIQSVVNNFDVMGIVGNGGASYIARCMGAGKTEEAERTLMQGFEMILAMGLLLALTGIFFAGPIARLLGARADTYDATATYTQVILTGAFFTMGNYAFGQLLRSEGSTVFSTIGMILGNADLKSVFLDVRVWLITLGRLLFYPAAAVLVLCFCGVFRLHPQAREIITVVALTAGAPAAVMVTQFAQMYRTEAEAQFASAVNIMTSVLCLATMPVISWLYQTLAY